MSRISVSEQFEVKIEGQDVTDQLQRFEMHQQEEMVDVTTWGSPTREVIRGRVTTTFTIHTPAGYAEGVVTGWTAQGNIGEPGGRQQFSWRVTNVYREAAVGEATGRPSKHLAKWYALFDRLADHLFAFESVEVIVESVGLEELLKRDRDKALAEAPNDKVRARLRQVFEADDWAQANGKVLVVDVEGPADDPRFVTHFLDEFGD